MKFKIIFLITLTIVTSAYAAKYVIGYIYVDPINILEPEPVTVEYYSGSGALDIDLPCLKDNNGRDQMTDNMYGILSKNTGTPSQGQWSMDIIPSHGEGYRRQIGQGAVTNEGSLITFGTDFFTLRLTWYSAQHPGTVFNLTWANPQAVDWHLTMYRRAR